ncbi:MAG TPA: D-2-hydroxyacid dehydrogenase [Firmicutes bacterium]|nr:D-2-hydroxyacid dehydrogenase [Bacillota bacterium]
MKILITHRINNEHLTAIQQAVPTAQVIVTRDEAEIAAHMPTANVIWGSNYLPALLPQCPDLAFIQVSSAGVDRLLQPELLVHPVQLINARGIHGTTIAEHVFLLMLALARQLPAMIQAQARHEWINVDPLVLANRTLGIIGYGSIGQAIGQRAKAFGMHVIATRRNPVSDKWADEVWGNDKLHKLLPLCDYIVLATPLTPETKHLIGKPELTLCKPSAVLINIARGPVIDEQALIDALQNGIISAAGLDVFDKEPLAINSPLWDMPQVIITPHMAGHMPDYDDNVIAIFLENLRRYQTKQPLINVVDKQAGY